MPGAFILGLIRQVGQVGTARAIQFRQKWDRSRVTISRYQSTALRPEIRGASIGPKSGTRRTAFGPQRHGMTRLLLQKLIAQNGHEFVKS
jgi:hypothetical protein